MRTHASTFAPFQTRERNYSRRVSKQLLRLDAAVQRLLAKPAGLPESAGWPEPAGLPETAGWPAPRGPPAAPFHQLDCAEPQPSTRSVSRGADGAALVVRGSLAPARDVGFLCPPPAAHEAAHIRDGCARGCGGGAGSSSLSRECGRGRGQGSESLRVCVRARGCGGGACSMNMNLRVPNCMNSVSSADRTPGISISFDCAMCRICFRITFSNSICGESVKGKICTLSVPMSLTLSFPPYAENGLSPFLPLIGDANLQKSHVHTPKFRTRSSDPNSHQHSLINIFYSTHP